MPIVNTPSISSLTSRFFPAKTPAAKAFSTAAHSEPIKTRFLQTYIEKLSKTLPSNMLTQCVLGILHRLCGYKEKQAIPVETITEHSFSTAHTSDTRSAVCMVYKALLAGKGHSHCATSVLALLKKEKSTRTIKNLIDIGLIKPEQLKEVELNEVKRSYLCSDQVIITLFIGLQADYKDLEKLPDSLVKNIQSNNIQIEMGLYLSSLLKQSISELKNAKNAKEVKEKKYIRMQAAIKNPWLMQIYTPNWHIPIHLAVIENNIYLINSFLKYGADTNQKTFNSNSISSIAACYGNFDIIKIFIEKNIPTDTSNKNGDTPLHFATYYNYPLVVEALAQKNPHNVNQVNHSRLSPLHIAALTGNAAIIWILLRHGALINAVDSNTQCTALHMASATGHMEATDALLEADANITQVNVYGEPPLACKPKMEYAAFQKRLGAFTQPAYPIEQVKSALHFYEMPIPSTVLPIKNCINRF